MRVRLSLCPVPPFMLQYALLRGSAIGAATFPKPGGTLLTDSEKFRHVNSLQPVCLSSTPAKTGRHR